MVCRNVCEEYRAKKPVGGMRYLDGQKRCQNCDLFIHWEGVRCPAAQQSYEPVQDEKGSNNSWLPRYRKPSQKLSKTSVFGQKSV